MAKETLTITDNRTGKQYEVAVDNGVIRAEDLKQIRTDEEDPGIMLYDPSFGNTASCKSRITFIDGDKGILRYRGYDIAELAEKSTYLETAYLIVKGELPDTHHLSMWQHNITIHTMVHENIKKLMEGFRHDAHPMGMLTGVIGALSTFYPEAKDIDSLESRRLQTRRLIGKVPTLAAYAYRHSRGLPYVYPDNELSYTGNFLQMMFRMTERHYKPNPVLERALDVLFILHADHEQNCSANAVRSVGSSHVDPYSAVAAGVAALYGPLHGGANEAVIRMLQQIGSVEKVPEAIKKFKAGEGRLMGFGHRVYKSFDPRAKLVKESADEVLAALGVKDDLLDIAKELEAVALSDDYFIERKLYPNVDFYTGVIYKAMGFPTRMFTVLFAIGRLPGWIANWREMNEDTYTKIGRPQQLYTGEPVREWPQR